MTTHLIVIAGMLWLFIGVPFFALGHEFLDPSGEYRTERQFWVTAFQWLALLGPPIAIWAGTRLFNSENQS